MLPAGVPHYLSILAVKPHFLQVPGGVAILVPVPQAASPNFWTALLQCCLLSCFKFMVEYCIYYFDHVDCVAWNECVGGA